MSESADVSPFMAQDPRRCIMVRADQLILDQRVQRELNRERIANIIANFDWAKFEPITVVDNGNGTYDVVEGQNRTAVMNEMSPHCRIWVVVIDAPSKREQAEVALGITRGRKLHNAFEDWRLCVNAGHPHQLAATLALTDRGIRLGKAPSSHTIGAIATVRKIVMGGGKSPAYGAALMGATVDIAMRAYPHDDHESCVARWSREVLLSISSILVAHPDIDVDRLVMALRARPAMQWIAMGKSMNDRPAAVVMREKVIEEYNRKLRKGRLSDD